MNLDDAPESENVEDSRGMGPKMAVGGGLGIVLLILGIIFNKDLIGDNAKPGGNGPQQANNAQGDPKTLEFVKKVLGTTEVVWTKEFEAMHKTYVPPHMVLFSEQVQSGCGLAPSAAGPFYCPADKTVYLDPTFFDELQDKLGGSKAEFSQAYVIAHEVGHHVQNLLGYSKLGKPADKDFSVRLELQADYLAGVWANHGQKTFHFIQKGEVDSAITTANAIGDDRLQKRSGGFVHPEQFTHGTSAQRVKWFNEGLKTGDDSKKTLDRFFEVPSSRDL
jgi:uncharacterized protein